MRLEKVARSLFLVEKIDPERAERTGLRDERRDLVRLDLAVALADYDMTGEDRRITGDVIVASSFQALSESLTQPLHFSRLRAPRGNRQC